MTKVSESLAKDIEIAALKWENFRLSATAELEKLTVARDALVQQARAEVGAPADQVYDTDTREFRAKDGPKPLSTTARRQAKRAQKAEKVA